MADIKLFAVENGLGAALTFQNLQTPTDNTQLPQGRGYTPGGSGKGCDVPDCANSGRWSGNRMVFQSPDGLLALNLFKNNETLYFSQGSDYPASPTQVPGTPDTTGKKNLLTIGGTTTAPVLSIMPASSYYRLELWFDWDDPTAKVGWGVTSAPTAAMTGSPTVLAKSNGTVQLYDASVSQLDIIVYDMSATPDSRVLENIELDFENDDTTGSTDPFGNANSLRNGQNGNAFSSGPVSGLMIYSYPGGAKASVCGWAARQSYQNFADGNYSFTGALRVKSGTTRKQFSIDPEMDISG